MGKDVWPDCEAYEVDFIGISEEKASKDADAICFRWRMSDGTYKIGVYDAGFENHGEAMVKHINKYYFNDENDELSRTDKFIDYVFVSHPHNDHAGGIPKIIESFDIGCIYMNCPWWYVKDLMQQADVDGRATEKTIEEELRNDYPCIDKIETLAYEKGIDIRPAFKGEIIEDGLIRILSPSEDYYKECIIKSDKTKRINLSESVDWVDKMKKIINHIMESWTEETLGDEHAIFDAENETSIILYGFKDNGGILLVGDAGVTALDNAYRNALLNDIDIKTDVKFVEIPHHGGRHNVTTSIMNELFGPFVDEDEVPSKIACVSVAEHSDHPRNVVVNAFLRRGFKVYKTSGSVRWYHRGDMPEREDFYPSYDSERFKITVEEW